MIFFDPRDLWIIFIFIIIAMIAWIVIYEFLSSKTGTLNKVPNSIESIVIKESSEPKISVVTAEVVEAKEDIKSDLNKGPILEESDAFYIQITVPVLRVRSKPNIESLIIRRFKQGMIVKVKKVVNRAEEVWYEIQQPSNLRYPERITGSWFIAGKYDGEWLTREVNEEKIITVFSDTQLEDKWIKIDLSEQVLYAFEQDKFVFEALISSGRTTEKYKTPTGNFRIFKKKLSAYMQGPLPDDDEEFDLPGIPFVMYFTGEGHALHGTYWHSNFGKQISHGCINLPIEKAEWLYWWVSEGTKIVIKE